VSFVQWVLVVGFGFGLRRTCKAQLPAGATATRPSEEEFGGFLNIGPGSGLLPGKNESLLTAMNCQVYLGRVLWSCSQATSLSRGTL